MKLEETPPAEFFRLRRLQGENLGVFKRPRKPRLVAAGVSPAVEGGILPPGDAAEGLFATYFQAFPPGGMPNSQ
jgi:hypothetical protein